MLSFIRAFIDLEAFIDITGILIFSQLQANTKHADSFFAL